MVIFSFQFILNLRTKVQNFLVGLQHWHTQELKKDTRFDQVFLF